MIERLRPWFPWLKALFSLAILAGVGVLFWRAIDNDDLRRADPSRPPWQILGTQLAAARPTDLVAAGLLYLGGLSCCAAFWLGLLRRLGGRVDFWPGVRAYTLSHLGKYAPLGKGWALVLRVALATQAGTRPGLAALSGAYETLAMMASGAFVAAVLLTLLPSNPHHLWSALALFVVAIVPILPGVFNRLVYRLARRFVRGDTLPSVGIGTLAAGMALTSSCWIFFGASLVAVLRGLDPDPGPIDPSLCLNCIAIVAVSYVAGFVASTPGGLGVRELLMQQLLSPLLHDPVRAIVAVTLLRVLWTAAELIAAAAIYWAPCRNRAAPLEIGAVSGTPACPAPSPLYPELTSSTNQPQP